MNSILPELTDKSGGIAATDTGTSAGSPALVLSLGGPRRAMALPQPVADVAEYLRTRRPVAHCDDEVALFMRLPSVIAKEVRALLSSFDLVRGYRAARISVTRACAQALEIYSTWNWNLKTYRAKYDAWLNARDWLVLVNRSKCGGDWVEREAGLSNAFLDYVAARLGKFGRADGKRQAIFSIFAQWRTGLRHDGQAEPIPGYEKIWNTRDGRLLPAGWHYSNITRQLKARGKFLKAQQAFLHDGESAARAHLPMILSDRAQLRFLELVTFDDVRTDWLVFDPATGQACELWLLVARCTATAMVLGFVMHPATVREDGKATHLGARHMKQLAGWMLERYPLPPYVVTWKLERGTAGMDEAVRAALGELLGNRIAFSITSMIGARTSPSGYAEKKKGNSRGKASHESHNRLLHTQGSYINGQTGNRWDIRPADLLDRNKEAVQIWQMRELLPEHLRGQEQYPLLTLNTAREQLFRICNAQNERTDHKLQGFEEIAERVGDRIIKRMESPMERAARLVRAVQGDWTPVSPAIITTFYEHTERAIVVKPNGEIEFQHDGRSFTFAHGGVPLVPGTKALGYYHPDDPGFLHVTDGRGGILGTWIKRGRVAFGDQEALAAAMRYTHLARESARTAANQLAEPQRAELEAMRQHNAELMQLSQFTDVTAAPAANQGTIGAPVGAALTTVSEAIKAEAVQTKKQEKQAAKDTEAARKTILDSF
jgi:hypothetical protein